jgi:hypothetical protein
MADEIKISIDPDIERVAEFVWSEIAVDRLIYAAGGIAALAPLL